MCIHWALASQAEAESRQGPGSCGVLHRLHLWGRSHGGSNSWYLHPVRSLAQALALKLNCVPQPGPVSLSPALWSCSAYHQALSRCHKCSVHPSVTVLSRKALCLHTERENQDLNPGPTATKPGALTNYCIMETWPPSPPSGSQECPSEFQAMAKSREGLASEGQEIRTPQALVHPHTIPTHIRRHLSFPPLATLWPSGLQSTAYT